MIVKSTISPALEIGLRFLGVWPRMPHSVYWLFYMPSTLVLQYFQYLYTFSHFKVSELSNLVDSLPGTLNYSLTFIKIASLWTHRRIVHRILIDMDNDWRECTDEQHLYVITIKANVAHLCSNAMLSLNAIAIVFYLFSGYAIRILQLVEDHNVTSRQLPTKIQLPFNMEKSPNFELLSITLTIHIILNVFTISIISSLMFSLVLHASGQIDIVCQELRKISEKNSLYGPSEFTFRMLIERHNKVISFAENIEDIFSFIALMQAVWNTLVICCLGFIIVISIHMETGGAMFAKTVLAYVAIMMEAFVFCFAGEYLSLKSRSIGDAAYESLWYDLPSNQAKIILFTIMRSQKPLGITAGRVANLTLEAFTSIMKASASYMSVLHAMY